MGRGAIVWRARLIAAVDGHCWLCRCVECAARGSAQAPKAYQPRSRIENPGNVCDYVS